MKYLAYLPLAALLLAASCEQKTPAGQPDTTPAFKVLFYNVENLFDTEDDPAVDDQEFLPASKKQWTDGRYRTKLEQIARVIDGLGGDTLPVLAGLCEIENRKVLDDLLASGALKGRDYSVIHRESPDGRGIDVALLYRGAWFREVKAGFLTVTAAEKPDLKTRDVLYARGLFAGRDTLHVFVGHWPSRSSGEVETRPLRMAVARLIREKIDSLFGIDPLSKVIVMGDFNDEPEDLSVVEGLKAILVAGQPVGANLYDLTVGLRDGYPGGTYKYRGKWELLDHMVVSSGLLDTTAAIYSRPADIGVYAAGYLLEPDEGNMGDRPVRTYLGDYYKGGYSDHLPVYLRIRVPERPGAAK